jgi:hypothetical protein
VESALVTTLFVVSSVGSSTCGLECYSDVTLPVELENVGRSVHGWLGCIGSGCGEDSRVCEVIVFERVGRLLISEHVRVGVCATYVEDITYGFYSSCASYPSMLLRNIHL